METKEMQAGKIIPIAVYKPLATHADNDIDAQYSVTFRITEACDLKCHYCHWHSGSHYTFEDITTTIDKLFEFFAKEDIQSVLFYYHGGEATRHSKCLDILKYVKQKSEETGIRAYNEMQTNLTIGVDKLEAMLPYCDRLSVSFHYRELKARGGNGRKLEAFNRNFEYLKSIGREFYSFDVMLENVEKENAEEFYELIKYYLSYPHIKNSEMIHSFCHYAYDEATRERHLQFYKDYNKTEQQYQVDDKIYNTNDLFSNGLDFRGWICRAGQDSITINGNGDVFHCGIHMTNHLRQCIAETPYTNLVTEKAALAKMSILYKTGTKCRWNYCGGDFYLHKTKPPVVKE